MHVTTTPPRYKEEIKKNYALHWPQLTTYIHSNMYLYIIIIRKPVRKKINLKKGNIYYKLKLLKAWVKRIFMN